MGKEKCEGCGSTEIVTHDIECLPLCKECAIDTVRDNVASARKRAKEVRDWAMDEKADAVNRFWRDAWHDLAMAADRIDGMHARAEIAAIRDFT